jgi:hypothetical protein
MGVILNRYLYPTLEELKWDILILQGFQMPKSPTAPKGGIEGGESASLIQ